ncbi:hypothetical protein K438DRAFT_1936495 [Mycena galopus ATCC 62051]|nr:hypothetical protein K438DRAFT_1936495 [Mycena galopus ATCC 62051]
MRHEHESDRENVAQERVPASQSLAGTMGRDEMQRGRKVGGKRHMVWRQHSGRSGERADREPELTPRKRARCEVEFRLGVLGTVRLVLQVKMQSGVTWQSTNAKTTMSTAHTIGKQSLELSPSVGAVKSQRRGTEAMEKKHPGRQNEIEQSIPQLSPSCLRARRLAPAHPIPAFLLRETGEWSGRKREKMHELHALPAARVPRRREKLGREKSRHKMPPWLCHGIMIAVGIAHRMIRMIGTRNKLGERWED